MLTLSKEKSSATTARRNITACLNLRAVGSLLEALYFHSADEDMIVSPLSRIKIQSLVSAWWCNIGRWTAGLSVPGHSHRCGIVFKEGVIPVIKLITFEQERR